MAHCPIGEITENGILRDMAACIVSYVDVEGLRHRVEVEAESLYEAAVLAVRTFRQHDCEPGELSKLEVKIRSSITHTKGIGDQRATAGSTVEELS